MKHHRFIAHDGLVYNYDTTTGHYEPEIEEETRIPLWRGLIPIVLIGFGAAFGAAYCLYRACEALLG
ncbi:hypothetical protein [Mesorhizobium sp. M4B.F.Ca.ET.143.01.1.1]|uniref:hypothetical protein n=1 Tax=Mesorhizobium sp. M4B.F.Ca.ET.143.01.1.1 TaxID=2563947 RepID=UPI00109369C5|nr:hypothetical protein [Mesorhizobium sp. M4B.F.Ca.ET.143.01.1.1]TGV26350.1 hypothetical protein EN786_12575 [Mesorhizobium sp. M4B.F.Ca.ET.143.01.1.1]